MQVPGSNDPIYYLYDANGNLWGLNYDGGVYFYVRNAQNDVIGIVDSIGAVVVTYSYDAWGKLLDVSGTLATTLGQDNPFRNTQGDGSFVQPTKHDVCTGE